MYYFLSSSSRHVVRSCCEQPLPRAGCRTCRAAKAAAAAAAAAGKERPLLPIVCVSAVFPETTQPLKRSAGPHSTQTAGDPPAQPRRLLLAALRVQTLWHSCRIPAEVTPVGVDGHTSW